jgi:drug/metabolite transporter (DMT)-like permease
MTVSVMLLVVFAGWLWGETIGFSSVIGIGLGMASIYFILGVH